MRDSVSGAWSRRPRASSPPRIAAILVAVAMVVTGLAGCLAGTEDPASGPADDGSGTGPFSDTDVFEGDYDTDQHRLPERGPYEVGDQSVTLVESRLDGVDIMIYVMRPDVPDGQEVPVIADIGPYHPPLHGADLSDDDLLVDFVSHGYAFALVSVRGTGDSGDCMDLMGPKERHDIDQAVTWLGTREWSNGNVGLYGISYDGSTQWQAASTGNPHLKTIVPMAGIPDLFSFMFRNGTFMNWAPAQFFAVYWLFHGPVLHNPATGRSVGNTLEQAVCPKVAEATAASMHSTLTGERDPFGFWEARDWRDDILANYTGSVYLIQGFQDATVEPHASLPLARALDEQGRTVKYTLGPWGHELPWRADSLEIMRHWYDRWLREDPDVDVGPKVQVQDTEGDWRGSDSWPPDHAEPTPLHLTPGGELADEPADGSAEEVVAPMAPVHDPVAYAQRHNAPWKIYSRPMLEVCPACPTFTRTAREGDLRFAGTPRLDLTVTPTGPGGHVTAVLHVVDDDGDADPVGYAQTDLRFAHGGDEARMVVPGQPMEAHLRFQALDVVVPEGSELSLTLHQGSYGVRAPSVPTYPITVDLGQAASTLTLATFDPAPDAFHDAPDRVGEGPPT